MHLVEDRSGDYDELVSACLALPLSLRLEVERMLGSAT